MPEPKLLRLQPQVKEPLTKYHIRSVLGVGGYGVVFSAERKSDHKQVAIKSIYKAKVPASNWINVDDPDKKLCHATFKQGSWVPKEIYFTHLCRHDQILLCLEYFEDKDFFFLVTEIHGAVWSSHPCSREMTSGELNVFLKKYLSNPYYPEQCSADLPHIPSMDLFECLGRFKVFPEKMAKCVFRQVCQAVLYLHQNNIAHRDIKEENLLIDAKFRVKLADFGAATFDGLLDDFQGTLLYASPEVIKKQRHFGKPADVWALGVLLFSLVFGHSPFHQVQDILHLSVPELLNEKRSQKVSPECLALLHSLLERDPLKRPTIQQVSLSPWLRIKRNE